MEWTLPQSSCLKLSPRLPGLRKQLRVKNCFSLRVVPEHSCESRQSSLNLCKWLWFWQVSAGIEMARIRSLFLSIEQWGGLIKNNNPTCVWPQRGLPGTTWFLFGFSVAQVECAAADALIDSLSSKTGWTYRHTHCHVFRMIPLGHPVSLPQCSSKCHWVPKECEVEMQRKHSGSPGWPAFFLRP